MIDLELNLAAYKRHIMDNILILCEDYIDTSTPKGKYIYFNVVNRFIKATNNCVGDVFGKRLLTEAPRYLKLSLLNERLVDAIVEDIREPVNEILSRFNPLITK